MSAFCAFDARAFLRWVGILPNDWRIKLGLNGGTVILLVFFLFPKLPYIRASHVARLIFFILTEHGSGFMRAKMVGRMTNPLSAGIWIQVVHAAKD